MSETMGKIHEAMASILVDVGGITKSRKNEQQGFKFRGIDDVYNAIHEVFAKHGVYMTTDVLSERSEERQTKSGGTLIYRVLTCKFTFHSDDGSCVSSVVIGEGMDSGDKASNKAMAVAHKYALLQAFCIPTEEEKDPDAQTHEVAPRTTTAPKPAAKTVAATAPAKFDTPNLPEGCPNPDAHCGTMKEQIAFIKAALTWLAPEVEDTALREWSKFEGEDKKKGGTKEYYLTLKNLDNPKDTWGKWVARVYGTAKEKVKADIALSAEGVSEPTPETPAASDGLPF